jgi:hypothetical protein
VSIISDDEDNTGVGVGKDFNDNELLYKSSGDHFLDSTLPSVSLLFITDSLILVREFSFLESLNMANKQINFDSMIFFQTIIL